MTAEGLATLLSLPVPEVEAELETLVHLGNLTLVGVAPCLKNASGGKDG